MTRTLTTFAADNSSLIADRTEGATILSFALLAVVTVAFVAGMVLLLKSGPMARWRLWMGYAAVWALFGIAAAVSINITENATQQSIEATQRNIAQSVKDKYGVTFVNDSDVLVKYAFNGWTKEDVVTHVPISAYNAKGERIQVTLELTVGARDVLAFSSGTEMKRVNESASKS